MVVDYEAHMLSEGLGGRCEVSYTQVQRTSAWPQRAHLIVQ